MTDRDVRQGYGVQVFSASLSNANGGHWNFAAGLPDALYGNLYPTPPKAPAGQAAPPVRPITSRPLRVAGQAAVAYRMPPYEHGGGIDSGHVVVAWRQNGTAYQISLHGDSNARKPELMAQAWILKIRAADSD